MLDKGLWGCKSQRAIYKCDSESCIDVFGDAILMSLLTKLCCVLHFSTPDDGILKLQDYKEMTPYSIIITKRENYK